MNMENILYIHPRCCTTKSSPQALIYIDPTDKLDLMDVYESMYMNID